MLQLAPVLLICSLFTCIALAIARESKIPFMHERSKTPDASSQVVKFYPSRPVQARYLGPTGTDQV